MAEETYLEVVARNPSYLEWTAGYAHLGLVDGLAPLHHHA
jgi:hypothetical protein